MTSPTPAEHTARVEQYIFKVLHSWFCASKDEATLRTVAEIIANLPAVNERASLLERVRKLEEALRKARNQVVAFAIPHIGAEDAERVVAYIDAALQPEQETA